MEVFRSKVSSRDSEYLGDSLGDLSYAISNVAKQIQQVGLPASYANKNLLQIMKHLDIVMKNQACIEQRIVALENQNCLCKNPQK